VVGAGRLLGDVAPVDAGHAVDLARGVGRDPVAEGLGSGWVLGGRITAGGVVGPRRVVADVERGDRGDGAAHGAVDGARQHPGRAGAQHAGCGRGDAQADLGREAQPRDLGQRGPPPGRWAPGGAGGDEGGRVAVGRGRAGARAPVGTRPGDRVSAMGGCRSPTALMRAVSAATFASSPGTRPPPTSASMESSSSSGTGRISGP
jgi:hypothetical protein